MLIAPCGCVFRLKVTRQIPAIFITLIPGGRGVREEGRERGRRGRGSGAGGSGQSRGGRRGGDGGGGRRGDTSGRRRERREEEEEEGRGRTQGTANNEHMETSS